MLICFTHPRKQIKIERVTGNEIVQVRMCDYVIDLISCLVCVCLDVMKSVLCGPGVVYTWAKTARLAETMQLCQHPGPCRLIGLY